LTFSWNQFFTVTAPVALQKGTNRIKFWAVEQYNEDGTTIRLDYSGTGGIGAQLRSNQAAYLAQIKIAPLNP
jgi:hypothetical protein